MELYSYEKEHIEILRNYAPECMVLLKSNGDFPLATPGRIALYGSGARKTIKGGTGSGDVNSRFYVTVEQGLENAGFSIATKEWLDRYDKIRDKASKDFLEGIKAKAKAAGVPVIFMAMGAVMPEPEYEIPAEDDCETAVYVLGRVSGEGLDRIPDKGDIQLTETEVRDIKSIYQNHKRFILVLNTGGPVDISPLADVGNILILSQLGVVTGDAFADVLLGRSYPSGKLTATWTAWDDHCSIGDFGDEDETRYREGIYVGYRYFDSVGKTPLFPFGYGLGFTNFKITDISFSLKGIKAEVSVKVRNTGKSTGKEVIQLYVSVPEGKLDQPFQRLSAFVKTDELKAGEEQTVSLGFAMEDIASFDTSRAASILEAGDYILRIGTSSRDTDACGIVRLEEEVVVETLHSYGGAPDFEDFKPDTDMTESNRADDLDSGAPVLTLRKSAFGKEHTEKTAKPDPGIMELAESLSNRDLARLCVGHFKSEDEVRSVIGNAAFSVAGAAGETTMLLSEKGIHSAVMADGPAGLRISRQYGRDEAGIYPVGDVIAPELLELFDDATLKALGLDSKPVDRNGEVHDQYCTAIPIGTALAQSWNLDLCRGCGNIVGSEMTRFGIHIWLAPALNIQRSPLCGRNFEYFSEDPLISGKIAGAITHGVQSHPGCGVTIKHYTCNNQERNRFRSNSIVSERALREIYLKGFEICIKETAPACLMTSYNLLNGVHTSERTDILEGILRGEWGYEGLVMSDWLVGGVTFLQKKYPYAKAAQSVKAGNDLMMPGSLKDFNDVLDALEGREQDIVITREEIIRSAQRVLQTVFRLVENFDHPKE